MSRSGTKRRWLSSSLGACVAIGLWLMSATGASAHALLVATTPQDGQILGTPPGTVVLEFSEAIDPHSSGAEATDPTGHRWPAQVTGGQEMRIALQTNAAGVYTVEWHTTSLDDGHHTSGSFQFGVRISPLTLAGVAGPGTQPQASDLLIGVAKWVEAVALLAVVGQLLVVTLAARTPRLDWVRVRYWPASIALAAGMIVIWAEVTVATGGHSASAEAAYFTSGIAGPARLGRLACELFAVVAALRRSRWLWVWTVAALAGVAASGHAAAVQPAWSGVLVDSLHLVAAGLWAGGIVALAMQRPPGGWRSSAGLALLRRFTPVALTAFGVTVVLGAVQALQQLGSADALVSTTYGEVLIAKIALVGCMLPLSWFAWRRRRPRLRLEASIAAAVIAAAAILSAIPLPPTAAARQAALLATTTSTAGLPKPGDLTMAGSAGDVLVGLSLEPGRPGLNHVLVYLLPPQGSTAAAGLAANLSSGSMSRPLTSCGTTCRQTDMTLTGGESLRVDVVSPGGGEATFTVPPLPAASGQPLVDRMNRVMHQLHSYAVTESLSSGRTTIVSDYTAVAPDSTTWTVSGTSSTVWIGTTEYTRSAPQQRWTVSRGLARNVVPSYVWDYFSPLSDAHIIGDDVVGGTSTTVVAAFGNRQSTAIWFIYWIDAAGVVRQVHMLAAGHFMADHYLWVNQPAVITPPLGTS